MVNDVIVDARIEELTAEGGQIFCRGELDILVDYTSYEEDDAAGQGLRSRMSGYMSGGGKLWQALLSLPFELTAPGELSCAPLCHVETGYVKWFMVAPRALEMEIGLSVVSAEENTKNQKNKGGIVVEIDKEVMAGEATYQQDTSVTEAPWQEEKLIVSESAPEEIVLKKEVHEEGATEVYEEKDAEAKADIEETAPKVAVSEIKTEKIVALKPEAKESIEKIAIPEAKGSFTMKFMRDSDQWSVISDQ
jgi:hypothetical protein